MKSIKQLLRQPLKSLLGVGLMALAVAVLVVCLGQYLAAMSTEKMLENTFSSVALPAGIVVTEGFASTAEVDFSEDMARWVADTAREHPEVIARVAEHGILNTHITELTPLNFTARPFIPENFSGGNWIFYHYQPEPYGVPYSTAMLEVVLEEVSEPEEVLMSLAVDPVSREDFGSLKDYLAYMEQAEKLSAIQGYTVILTGRVKNVVSLQEGFRDPTGMIIRMTVTRPTLEEIENLKLEAGYSYLVCGMDYVDMDWALRGYLASEHHHYPQYVDEFDLTKMKVLTEEEQAAYLQSNPHRPIYAVYNGSITMSQQEYEAAGAVHLTLESAYDLIDYDPILDESERRTELRPITEVTVYSPDGTETSLSIEEYTQRYAMPTIAKLESSVEDFLSSEEGELWRATLDLMGVNNQAFPVLGVEKVGYLADFARENSRIVEGREFSVEEQQNGSRVCVIHEALAAANGLTVGDTITLSLYQTDRSFPYQGHWTRWGEGLLTPSATFYFSTTPFTETAEYTIVGLWRGQELWGDVAYNTYTLSPNTVIVPKSSVETPMEHPESVLFSTIVLNNGTLEEFKTLTAQGGYEDRFVCHDQGYSDIAENFHNYDTLGKRVLLVGAAVYAMVLLLYLLFFPGAQGKTLWTMESLGATRMKRFAHVLIIASAMLVSATVLGALIGFASWDIVLDKLQTSAKSSIRLTLEPIALVQILMAQLSLALALSCLMGVFLSRSRKLSKRR